MNTLDAFLPAVQAWFREAFGEPTPPQALGWPAIQRGDHTLILSPTGSGKTLAAFLWGIDQIWRELCNITPHPRDVDAPGDEYEPGVRLLYVSPLKALNNDVERNLRAPLAGIRRVSDSRDEPLPALDVLVRTGDTPQSQRRRMVKRPPHILITTPESLYLILTSPVARDMFRTVRTVILDEIHTLVDNKRGVHLALTLERLVELADQPIQRIGLSATQRPLEEVSRFLGGFQPSDLPAFQEKERKVGRSEDWNVVERPVTIVDAGMVKPMDLQVVLPVDDFRNAPGGSIWAAVIPRVMDLIERHNTTLIFANSRRLAERTADRLNDVWMSRMAGGDPSAELIAGEIAKGIGFQGTGTVGGPFRAHHGSVSRERRLDLEQALKKGQLPALVGTASLELGIDIGDIDLVVQLESPTGVARGLQRVGRSGHLVGQTSKGRFFPTNREDLLESAAITHAMLAGDVEPSYTPQNSLDVLAQQIVAMVSVKNWEVHELYALVRRAYPYYRLTPDLYHSVLNMLSGRYPSDAFRELRPRIAWDRVHNRLAALPGSRLLAIRNGGTIPDRGTFGAYLPDRKTRLGELDEEFVFETRPGDVFALGSNTWRVQEVTEDRVIVTPAPGYLPRMPFWRGDLPRRDYHLGLLYGRFRRELAERVMDSKDPERADIVDWLRGSYRLDTNAARSAVEYVAHQVEVLGAISSDRTIVAEMFRDQIGDLRLVIHSCFGARVNSPWALALASALREQLGIDLEVMVSDDGILFRFLEAAREPALDLLTDMGPVEARERVLGELPNSALFGAQFRMNAARALLLPSTRGTHKRTPFWLQRLRAKDLLAVAGEFDDFPIVAETYRDCLRDVLDLSHLEEVLRAIQSGEVEVVFAETIVPSPVAGSLLYDLINKYMYEWDQPKAEKQMQALMVGRELLAQLLDEAALPDLLRPEAVSEVENHLQHLSDGTRARTAEELTTLFLALGDLTAGEAAARSDGPTPEWIEQLTQSGRLVPFTLRDEARYILAEHVPAYTAAFGLEGWKVGRLEDWATRAQDQDDAARAILRRVLSTHAPLTREWLLKRYPFPVDWLDTTLQALVDEGTLVYGQITNVGTLERSNVQTFQYCDRRTLEHIHRRTLALLRQEVEPVSLYAYADFVARWQHLHPAALFDGPGALVRLLQHLRGVPAPGPVWERDVLPLRLADYDPAEMEALCARGEVAWVVTGGKDPRRARVRFFFRGEGGLFLPPAPDNANLSPAAQQVLAFLRAEGASFFGDLEAGTELPHAELTGGLVELVLAGLVTNDTLHALRRILAWTMTDTAGERAPLSALEAELAAWRSERQPPDSSLVARPERGRLHRAQRDITRRFTPPPPLLLRGGAGGGEEWPGRWSLVHRIGVWGKERPPHERIGRQARQLLLAYGIVTRESLEAVSAGGAWEGEEAFNWRALYPEFQRLEMRGEVRRGYFVQGLPGVQYALPEAVEHLREWTRPDAPGAGTLVLLNAADPANLFGPAADTSIGTGEESEAEGGAVAAPEPTAPDPARFGRIPSNYVVLLRGRPVLLVEMGAGRLTTLPDVPRETLKQALVLAVDHAAGGERLILSHWNGEPILDTEAGPLLEEVGFRREVLDYIWDR
ncbi:MAG: DEAD/DEAH box helicase [Anaerolineae bacterium]|nr:DEAD/DEAH box helicase [Anaerolineae bacterium]